MLFFSFVCCFVVLFALLLSFYLICLPDSFFYLQIADSRKTRKSTEEILRASLGFFLIASFFSFPSFSLLFLTPFSTGPDPRDEKREEKPFVGMKNLGATCYLNSTLQCLYAITPLRNLLLSLQITEEQQSGKFCFLGSTR